MDGDYIKPFLVRIEISQSVWISNPKSQVNMKNLCTDPLRCPVTPL